MAVHNRVTPNLTSAALSTLSQTHKNITRTKICIKGESNPRRVDGNDPGYHYPINALQKKVIAQ